MTNKMTAEADARLKSLLSKAVWYIYITMVCSERAGVPAGPPSVQRSLKARHGIDRPGNKEKDEGGAQAGDGDQPPGLKGACAIHNGGVIELGGNSLQPRLEDEHVISQGDPYGQNGDRGTRTG